MLTNAEKMTKLANDLSAELSVTPPDSPLRWDSKELVPLVEFVIARLANDAPPALPDEPPEPTCINVKPIDMTLKDAFAIQMYLTDLRTYVKMLRAHRGK